jgi:FkbM family methyltransferase
MPDSQFDLSHARTLHRIDASDWLGTDASAYWCEWMHPAEGPRIFSDIVDSLVAQNWHRYISAGATCIDIGAHSADTSIPMGLFAFDKMNGTKGAIYAVEPNPSAAGILALNLGLNPHIADFHAVHCAITEVDVDQIELADHGNANCNGGILEGVYSQQLQTQLREVAVEKYFTKGISLATLIGSMPDNHRKNLQFIKIDCEGYDKEIIRGAKDILREIQPTLLLEWFAWFTPEDDADFFSAISEIGYRPLNPWTLERLAPSTRVSDVLCVPA